MYIRFYEALGKLEFDAIKNLMDTPLGDRLFYCFDIVCFLILNNF